MSLIISRFSVVFFFFQAEDGIRDGHVTGVQTCALPISVSAAVKKLPDVFDATGVPPDQCRQNVIFQVGYNGHLPAIKGGIADTVKTVFGDNFYGHEVAARAGHNHFGVGYLHALILMIGLFSLMALTLRWPQIARFQIARIDHDFLQSRTRIYPVKAKAVQARLINGMSAGGGADIVQYGRLPRLIA